ncbi:glycosyltransferase family 28 C-terminal domain-containing protein [Vararia minispora EC-137]|uniref:Glycosyltransferase family 28 C-terminal domain-containing protein n=1 Tax=Vararia minispora EC-137 TaxID=1314806 RepID=A0ACB8QTM2_9AGAM|nr:glycosyltransferase family 28 C-terminal domain-containing protein [Vararia minispora EC-137]
MRVFVTVGSTRFDRLVQWIVWDKVLDVLRDNGYTDVVIQCGSMGFQRLPGNGATSFESRGCNIQVYRFKPSLEQDYDAADLVISHAGSGTILDVLRKPKPLIAIVNDSLLDNHQKELADALSALGHIKTLRDAIHDIGQDTLIPFPPLDGSRFRMILDREMGYDV